jgi:proteic killer suppression protein
MHRQIHAARAGGAPGGAGGPGPGAGLGESLSLLTKRTVMPYIACMKIASFRHKGLKRFYEDDDSSGLPSASIRKIRNILAVLEFADDLSEVETMPGWNLHRLKGGRRGVYSIIVTRNWRLTFRVIAGSVIDVDFEDYH